MKSKSPERLTQRKVTFSPIKRHNKIRTTENSFNKFSDKSNSSIRKSLNFISNYYDVTSEIYEQTIPENSERDIDLNIELIKDIEYK